MKKEIMITVRVLGVVAILAGLASSLSYLTIPNSHVTGAVIYAAPFNENMTAISAAFNSQRDTLENKFVRITDFRDSTIDTVKCKVLKVTDSIRSLAFPTNGGGTVVKINMGSPFTNDTFQILSGKVRVSNGNVILNGTSNIELSHYTSQYIFWGEENGATSIRVGVRNDSFIVEKSNGSFYVKIGGFY
jgi:hypothetical protein